MVVHRQRQVMRSVLGRFLGPRFQPRIDRKRHLRYFVNRRRNGRRLVEAVSRSESLQLVGVHGIHDVVEQFAQLGITVKVEADPQQPVHGVVKILARGFQMAGFEVLFPRNEFFLDFLDQVVLPGGNRRQQPNVMPARRI